MIKGESGKLVSSNCRSTDCESNIVVNSTASKLQVELFNTVVDRNSAQTRIIQTRMIANTANIAEPIDLDPERIEVRNVREDEIHCVADIITRSFHFDRGWM